MASRISEREKKILFEHSPNGLSIYHRNEENDFVCELVNQTFVEIIGGDSVDAMLGQRFEDIFENQTPRLSEIFQATLMNREKKTDVIKIESEYFEVVCIPLEEKNQVVSIIFTLNSRRRFSPQFYGNQSLLDAMQDVIFIYDVDENGDFRMNFVNEANQKATGFNNERDFGKTVVQLMGEDLGRVIHNNFQRCVDSRETIQYEEFVSLPAGDHWWYTKLSPVIVDGKVIQIVGSARDITELKEKEARIQALLDEYRVMFDATQTVMWVNDVDEEAEEFRVNRYNKVYEEKTGMRSEDFRGKSVSESISEPFSSMIRQNHLKCLHTRKPITYEETLEVGNRKGTFITNLSPVIRDGKVVQIVGSSSDITELKRYQEELKLEREMLSERVKERTKELENALFVKDEFLAIISQEIYSPVTAILGFSELLSRLVSEDAAHYRYIKQVYRHAQMLSVRFQDLMNTASTDRQMNELNYEYVDLENLYLESAARYQEKADEKKIELVLNVNLPIKEMWVDAARVRLICDRVIEDVIQMNQSGKVLTTELSYEGHSQQLCFHFILSTGAEEHDESETSFSFSKEEPFNEGVTKKTSLNLLLVERVVELMDGKMVKERNEQGNTCQITIHLPLLRDREKTE